LRHRQTKGAATDRLNLPPPRHIPTLPKRALKARLYAASRALINLSSNHLESQGRRLRLVPGMQVNAEIHLGNRSVLEYLLSPVQKVVHEAGRER